MVGFHFTLKGMPKGEDNINNKNSYKVWRVCVWLVWGCSGQAGMPRRGSGLAKTPRCQLLDRSGNWGSERRSRRGERGLLVFPCLCVPAVGGEVLGFSAGPRMPAGEGPFLHLSLHSRRRNCLLPAGVWADMGSGPGPLSWNPLRQCRCGPSRCPC